MSTEATPTVLRVGYVPGVTTTKWRRIWAERLRRIRLDVVAVDQADQRRAILDGAVDMCFVRNPIDIAGLHLIPLYDEVPVVWLSKDHLLAALDEVTSDDLADENVLTEATPENIELATYSAAVLRVPLSVARSGSRKDMIHLPVLDAEETHVGLAWRKGDENPLLDEFVGVVRGRTANSSRTVAARDQREGGTTRTRRSSHRR